MLSLVHHKLSVQVVLLCYACLNPELILSNVFSKLKPAASVLFSWVSGCVSAYFFLSSLHIPYYYFVNLFAEHIQHFDNLVVLSQKRCRTTTETNRTEHALPEIRTDGSEHISVTGEGLAVVHLHDDVGQLRFVVQGFELLENGAGVQGVYPVIACACRSPILNL